MSCNHAEKKRQQGELKTKANITVLLHLRAKRKLNKKEIKKMNQKDIISTRRGVITAVSHTHTQ